MIRAGQNMPDVMEWLRNHAGFELPVEEVQSILHFTLLWSLFEKALGEDGGPPTIVAAVERWERDGRLRVDGFKDSFDYFKQRYFPNGREGARFAELGVGNRYRDRVANALGGANAEPREAVIAVLLVVNRLRNNLMHGPKWTYKLVGQGENFHNANQALLSALDCNGGFT